jgi:hypothetical protein
VDSFTYGTKEVGFQKNTLNYSSYNSRASTSSTIGTNSAHIPHNTRAIIHEHLASLKCEQSRSTVSMHIVKEETGKRPQPTTWPNAWTTPPRTWAPEDEVTSEKANA